MIDRHVFCVCVYVFVCVFSQCVAGYGGTRLCRDVPSEASAAPLWGVCVRVFAEHAQPGTGLHQHQCDPVTEESKGGLEFLLNSLMNILLKTLYCSRIILVVMPTDSSQVVVLLCKLMSQQVPLDFHYTWGDIIIFLYKGMD